MKGGNAYVLLPKLPARLPAKLPGGAGEPADSGEYRRMPGRNCLRLLQRRRGYRRGEFRLQRKHILLLLPVLRMFQRLRQQF